MINFFKHIRRRYISEGLPAVQTGKTQRYFKYAIGEIILVVIGILIALQINNWNENQKFQKQELQYLSRLIKENKKDVLSFKIKIERLESNNAKIKGFCEGLKNADYSDSLLLKRASEYMIYGSLYPNFNPSLSTYRDLSSTGNLNLIKDTELRDLIVGHYTAYDVVKSNFQINKDWAIPIDAPLFIETNALQFDTNFTSSLFSETSEVKLAKDLRNEQDIYLRNASLHYWINTDCITYLKQIKEETEELITTINNKIET